MAYLEIVEIDAHGGVLGTQTVGIAPGGTLSAPFHAHTATLMLTPHPRSATAIITFGASPMPVSNGIHVSEPMCLSPGGARMAIL